MEELLLWRWSTAVQISSTLLIAGFFVVFSRSAQRKELRLWLAAWLANGAALAVTWAFWLFQPEGWTVAPLLAVYFACKTSFIALLLLGTIGFRRPERAARLLKPVLGLVCVLSFLGAFTISTIDLIGVLQASIIAIGLALAVKECLRSPGGGLGWLALGCALRGVLGMAEAIGYGLRLGAPSGDLPEMLGVFLAAHSSFDTGAEWVIALGCVLAITHRVHDELERSHAELNQAHVAMREVAERDPLTGLYNRRMLKPLLDERAGEELELLFFDLDDFKQVNDSQGHEVGDACLVRFAQALRRHFPAAYARVRFAGDEFVVFGAPGLAEKSAALRADIAHPDGQSPAMEVSMGRARLAAGGPAEVALREADLAMYREKAARPDRRRHRT